MELKGVKEVKEVNGVIELGHKKTSITSFTPITPS